MYETLALLNELIVRHFILFLYSFTIMSFIRVTLGRFFSLSVHIFLFLILNSALIFVSILDHSQETNHSSIIYVQNSSISCNYNLKSDKLCFFNDIYFIKDNLTHGSFIFRIDKYSMISGLKSRNDLKTINLSAVKNHPKMFMNLILVDSMEVLMRIFSQPTAETRMKSIERASLGSPNIQLMPKTLEDIGQFLKSRILIVHEPIFVIRRFKCDNLMHVFHDDLLPLFITYHHLCDGDIDRCIERYRLSFNDDCTSQEFYELYKIFSVHEPLVLSHGLRSDVESFPQPKQILLFKTLRVGIDTSSVWFSYGFTDQQGKVEDLKIESALLEKFCNFLIEKLQIKADLSHRDQTNILILNRRINRKILNIHKLTTEIVTKSSEIFQSKISVIESDLLNNTVQNLIQQILEADIIIGMHSSTMILTIFSLLKRRTLIFELFPFGIQPEYVSFLYPLKEICSPRITLKFWVNQNENNAVTHPNNDRFFGGLEHLPLPEQKKIIETKLIPPVKCCHDPAYLFRMYQDTIVGEEFLKLYRSSIKELNNFPEGKLSGAKWFLPAVISDVRCLFNDSEVLIDWETPKNVLFHTIKYKIAISVHETDLLALTVSENRFVLNVEDVKIFRRPLKLSVWIKSTVFEHGEADSLDTYTLCVEND